MHVILINIYFHNSQNFIKMAKFFKNLFSSSTLRIKEDDVVKNIAKSNKDITNNKDNTNDKDNTTKEVPSYDTQKKMSISRSGRMKHNAKLRGKLNDELYGKEVRTIIFIY